MTQETVTNIYGNMHPRLTVKNICIQQYIKYQAPMEFLPAINLAMESIISQIVQSLKYLGAVFTL